MVRGWIYSIIGGVVALAAFRSIDPRRDPRLLPPARASSSVRGAVAAGGNASPPAPSA